MRRLQFGWRRRLLSTAAMVGLALSGGTPVTGQTFDAPSTRALYQAAVENWRSVDASVLRYTARVQQRAAAALRTPLRDRTLFRSEAAARVFWDRDHDPVVQILASDAHVLGTRAEVSTDGVPSGFTIDEAFDPGGDRLVLGLADPDEPPDGDDYYIIHPLGSESSDAYRYEGGDTLTLRLPDGRELRSVELRVIPTVASANHVTGSLWIEPESGALVRAVYRLSRQLDLLRDLPDVAEEDASGEFDLVPGFLKPWTFDLTLVSVEYALWDFEVWLPRSMRVEGQVQAGVLKVPASFDVAYRIESVVTERDVASGDADAFVTEELTFATREEALAHLAELTGVDEEVAYETVGRYLVPVDRGQLRRSSHLPPPIWEDAAGFVTEADLERFEDLLDDLPRAPVDPSGIRAGWGWGRPGALRYNRIEALAVGGGLDGSTGGWAGPIDVTLSGRIGIADLEPKARLSFTRDGPRRRVTLAGYRELQTVDDESRALDLGNSLSAFLFGRDDGEYFLGTGAEVLVSPPGTERESWRIRFYGERQHAVFVNTDVTVAHAFDSGWRFRPNVRARGLEEVGAEVRIAPWWGRDPLRPRFGLELNGHAAAWRSSPGAEVETSSDYLRSSLTARLAVPLAEGRWSVGLEAGGGASTGDLPIQRNWFIGGPRTLRGYETSVLNGTTFGRARLEVSRRSGATAIALFGDGGWAGDSTVFETDDILWAVGIGASLVDGLVRLDLSRGLTGPGRRTRLDLYLDAIL